MIMAAYFLVLYGGVGFIQFSEQLAENFFSFLLLILGQRIVLLVKLMCLLLDFVSPFLSREKELAV